MKKNSYQISRYLDFILLAIIAIFLFVIIYPVNDSTFQVNSRLTFTQIITEGDEIDVELKTTSFSFRNVFPIRVTSNEIHDTSGFRMNLERDKGWEGIIRVYSPSSYDPIIYDNLLYQTSHPTNLTIESAGFGMFVNSSHLTTINVNDATEVEFIEQTKKSILINNVSRSWIAIPTGETRIVFSVIRPDNVTISQENGPDFIFSSKNETISIVLDLNAITTTRFFSEGHFSIESGNWNTLDIKTWSKPTDITIFYPQGLFHYESNTFSLNGGENLHLKSFEGNVKITEIDEPHELFITGTVKSIIVGNRDVTSFNVFVIISNLLTMPIVTTVAGGLIGAGAGVYVQRRLSPKPRTSHKDIKTDITGFSHENYHHPLVEVSGYGHTIFISILIASDREIKPCQLRFLSGDSLIKYKDIRSKCKKADFIVTYANNNTQVQIEITEQIFFNEKLNVELILLKNEDEGEVSVIGWVTYELR